MIFIAWGTKITLWLWLSVEPEKEQNSNIRMYVKNFPEILIFMLYAKVDSVCLKNCGKAVMRQPQISSNQLIV